jgi:thiamine kinase-like enzyme
MYPQHVSDTRELEGLFGSLLDQVDLLRNRTDVSELSGGLTNRNLLVHCGDVKYVARISSNSSSLLSIDRESDFNTSKIAAGAQVGAPVHGYLPGKGLLVIGFLEGRTYEAADVSANLPRVAASVKALHGCQPFLRDFNMFEIQQRYLAIVQERGFEIPSNYLDFAGHITRMKEAMKLNFDGLVPCNNDLLPGNFIDDGEKIWLIDYEYSGNNEAAFELGNIWAEAFLPYEKLEELVTAYYGRYRKDKIARAWLQALLGKYGWTLWAAIQDGVSDLDFDFKSWGGAKYELAQSEFTSKRFEEALGAITEK